MKINFLKSYILLFGVLITQQGFSQKIDSAVYYQVKNLQESAKKTFAPDKRVKLVTLSHADAQHNRYVIETTEKEAKADLEQKLKGIKAQVTVISLPDTSVAHRPFGVVTLSVANMRTYPDNAAEMASQSLLGTQVDLLQKSSGNYLIRTPDGYIAWAPTSAITAMDKSQLDKWRSTPKIIYTNDFGKSLSKPDQASVRVSDLVFGDILALQETLKEYYKVAYPDGRIAFLKKSESSPFNKWLETRNPSAENILASAKSMLGLPYLWGGTSTKGVDCSGFTKTSFFINGIIIPRDASQQVLVGKPVDVLDAKEQFDPQIALKNLKPADLLFFAAGKGQRPNARVTHVALYIGNGVFIHASGEVRISSMLKDAPNYDDFNTRTLVAARRYIGNEYPGVTPIAKDSYYTTK